MKNVLLALFVTLAVAGALLLSPLGIPDAPQPPRPVPSAWFCRVWTGTQVPDGGPACEQYPATYQPPWPYLGEHGQVVTPEPSP